MELRIERESGLTGNWSDVENANCLKSHLRSRNYPEWKKKDKFIFEMRRIRKNTDASFVGNLLLWTLNLVS